MVPEASTPEREQHRLKLDKEIQFAEVLLNTSQEWIPQLRKKLSGADRKDDTLASVCVFFAGWSLHLAQGILTLIRAQLFTSSFLLLRSLIEAHMELSFILHRDCENRSAEYLKASKESRPPYKGIQGMDSFSALGRRAGSCGLGELYRKTYLSLSYYSHLRVRGSLAADPDSEIALREATACLIIGETILAKVTRQLARAFDSPMPHPLAQAYAGAMRRYKTLVRSQETALARLKAQSKPIQAE